MIATLDTPIVGTSNFGTAGSQDVQMAAIAGRARLLSSSGSVDLVMPINSDADIVGARERGRAFATVLGFAARERALITTAISELARNIVLYAERGEIRLGAVQSHSANGIHVLARDDGPGIENVEFALKDGFSTSGGLGLGLPGVRRLMDDFEIESHTGGGTAVRVTKWLTARPA